MDNSSLIAILLGREAFDAWRLGGLPYFNGKGPHSSIFTPRVTVGSPAAHRISYFAIVFHTAEDSSFVIATDRWYFLASVFLLTDSRYPHAQSIAFTAAVGSLFGKFASAGQCFVAMF